MTSSFSGDVLRFAEKAKNVTTKTVQVAALEVFNSLTSGSAVTGSQGTPVKDGFAINSWSVLGSQGTSAGAAELARMKLGDVRTIEGRAIYLRGLEEGRARQKPAGWVRLTVAMWPRIVAWAVQQATSGGGSRSAAVPGGGSLRRSGSTEGRKPAASRSRNRRKF